MNLADVMDQIAARVATIPDLRCLAYPPAKVTPPTAFVDYPENITPGLTYRRGMDRMTLPLILLVGNAFDRAARDNLADYCDGAGPRSIIEVVQSGVDAGSYTAFDEVTVTGIDFDPWRISTVDYMAAQFTLDIAGSGSA